MLHADTSAEILSELIPGYAGLEEADRRTARIAHADRLALAAQESRIAAAIADGTLDPNDPEAAGLFGLLRAPRSEPIALETEDVPGEDAPWLGAPELVLVTTTYAPHTAAPPVGGNVVWLDPDTEDSYLGSLRTAGAFSYWSRD